MIVIPQMVENQMSLLKKCIEFYADENNHKKTLANNQSMVDVDNGFLARETIKNVQNLENQNIELSNQYEMISNSPQLTPESIMIEVQKIIDNNGKA